MVTRSVLPVGGEAPVRGWGGSRLATRFGAVAALAGGFGATVERGSGFDAGLATTRDALLAVVREGARTGAGGAAASLSPIG
jgi:hypothetical protein